MSQFNPPYSHTKPLVFLACLVSIVAIILAGRPTGASNSGKSAATPINSAVLNRSLSPAALNLVVNDAGDASDTNVGDSICDTSLMTGDQCTLRAAIQETNVATSGTDVINFSLPANSIITLENTLDFIYGDLNINGPGANTLTVQRSAAGGTPRFRIFVIMSRPIVVNISSLTISNGHTLDGVNGAGGGGVLNDLGATTNLTNVVIKGNTTGNGTPGSGGFGGGIFNFGPMTITNSTVSGNSTGTGGSDPGAFGGYGGGIYNAGTLTLINTTVSGNTSGYSESPTSGGYGGGIYNTVGREVTLINSTLSGNRAGSGGFGGGIRNAGTANLKHTIVANNTATGAPGPDLSGAFNSHDYNFIENATGATFTGTTTHNITGLDPKLGPLANNGSPTQTHALLAGSAALDAGDNLLVTNPPFGGPPFTDQRGLGFVRIVDGPDADSTDTVDIGAFEAQVWVADIANQTINEDGALSFPLNVGDAASITSVTATSSNTTLVPNEPANISISGSGSNRTLLINPVANAFGTSTITVTVNGSNSQTMADMFVLTVNPVNDAPAFIKGPDRTANENDGAQTVNNWATNISAGPAESGQTLTFNVANNTNSALFAVAPAIGSSGTLTYSVATGIIGMATITVALTDNGGVANGGADTSPTQTFNITVLGGGALQFSSATFLTAEDGANTVITVTRTGGTAGEARVNYATSNGTATAGEDYSVASGTLIFANGVTNQSFSPLITNDAVDEPDETITLTLTSPAGSGRLGNPVNAILTINDNDPTPGIAINDMSITEGDGGTVNVTFTVSLSGQSSQTVTVDFATGNGTATAGSDFQTSSGTVTFEPFQNTKMVTVTVNGDVNFESNETYFVNLSNPVNATISDSQGLGTILNDDAQGGFISFSASHYTIGERGGFVTIAVNRTNDVSGASTVDYATSDDSGSPTLVTCPTVTGIASSRCDFTTARGTLQFAAGENSKAFVVLISQDNYVEGPEALTLTLSNLTGGALFATPSTATLTITDDATEPAGNPIDSADAFVRQHYHDFLNREPDAAGLAFWSDQITACGADTACVELRRINVSAAFFISIEFQQTGYLVYRMYKAAYEDLPNAPVPVTLSEFLPDTREIGRGVVVGQTGWEQQLENNKIAFTQEFASRPRFTTDYPTTMTPTEFVDALFTKAGVTPSAGERTAVIGEFGAAPTSAEIAARARVLRRVAEHPTLTQTEFNKAFVLMQYFGYLRRNPNEAPDADFAGYNFWLDKLNQFNGNFVNAEMVKAFLLAAEYTERFGP